MDTPEHIQKRLEANRRNLLSLKPEERFIRFYETDKHGLDEYVPEFFLPQWLVYPEIEPFSVGWRMGYGEDYLIHLREWREQQSLEALKEYDAYFPPPEEWAEAMKLVE